MKPEQTSSGPSARTKVSMHDDVEVWEDCCVCEPEPRWQQLADEIETEGRQKAQAQSDDGQPPPAPPAP